MGAEAGTRARNQTSIPRLVARSALVVRPEGDNRAGGVEVMEEPGEEELRPRPPLSEDPTRLLTVQERSTWHQLTLATELLH